MPRKVARRRNYAVPFAGVGIKPVDLTRKRDAIMRALGCPPSTEFMNAYSFMLGVHKEHRASISRSTPAAVQKRIEAVVNAATTLQTSLSELEATDRMLFGDRATKRIVSEQRYTGLDAMLEAIAYFLPVIEEALTVITNEPKHGRMPAFAERALAKGLCQILFEETKLVPTSKRGGTFDRLLRLAFALAQNRSDRRDVTDLMRISLTEPPQDQSLLSTFRIPCEFSGPAPTPGKGTKSPK